MKMVIDGNAGAGTIQMGGFDYTRVIVPPARRAMSAPASASAPAWNMRRARVAR